jgi:ZIP family zinc transporter
MGPLLQVVAFTLPAVAIAAVAGGVATWRPPGPRLTSAIQHLAAGIVFAAAALELLPQERHEAALPVAIGFAIGLALMLGLRVLAERLEARDERSDGEGEGGLPVGLIVVTGIDLLVDGIVLGIGFAAGAQTGVLLAVALTLEVLFVSLSVSAAMSQGGAGRRATLLAPAGLALVLLVSAVLSRLLLADLHPFAFTLLLGAGTVALLYLVVEELLVEAHEVQETPWATAAFFAGFLLFLMIEMAVEG